MHGRSDRPPHVELSALRTAFVTSLAEGDASAACAVYAEDATLVPPAADRLKGRAPIESFWAAGVEAGITAVELEAVELGRPAECVYELGRYVMRLDPAGDEPVLDRGTYLLVHERDADGGWRRAVEMFSPDDVERTAADRGRGDAEGRESKWSGSSPP